MRLNFSMGVILAALGVACGPETPGGDSDGGSSSGAPPPGSTSEAPGSTTQPDGPTTGGPTTEAPTTGETTTGETTTGETTTGGSTTGEPTCPIGQPSLAPLWSRTLPVSEVPDVRAGRWIGVLNDGTIAVEGSTRVGDVAAPGVFRAASDGESAEWKPGALTPGTDFFNVGLRVAADGSIVVVGGRAGDPLPEPYVARFAADGTELARVALQTVDARRLWGFELDGEALVVVGHGVDGRQRVARVDAASGVPEWEIELPALDVPLPGVIDVGPGGEVVVGHGIWPNSDDPEFKVWRVDAGAVAWERDLLPQGPSAGLLNDLVVTPDGEVVALTLRADPTPRLVAAALALADGASLWELDVAVTDASGEPSARRWLVDDDALTLAVVRTADGEAPEVEVHRVSFDGVHLGATTLAADGVNAEPPRLTAARGACGELILFQETLATPWLAAFAP